MLLDEIKNKIINADCLEIMRQLPDKCIDVILTDPPYGINANNMKMGSSGINFHEQKRIGIQKFHMMKFLNK